MIAYRISRVLYFYLETTTRFIGKFACTQVKCLLILPTNANEVPYARAKDIDFSSANKLKEKLDVPEN